jgi:glycosyltransferase involved in cell wall biosynthesis
VRRILFVHSRKVPFVEIDREALAERWTVEDWLQPGRVANLAKLVPAVARSDLVFGWFASWHTFFPITLAWLLRKPSVLVVGGFDVANMPEIGYGYQQGGLRKWASRWIVRRASRLVTNSYYSRREIERNIGLSPDDVAVIHHGVPDPFGELPSCERESVALTVGFLARTTLERKGHRVFVETAARLPEVRFEFAGEWLDDSIDRLRAIASDNVVFTSLLGRKDFGDVYTRASVYVQPSRHESFGMSIAEAMLAGCVPVVTEVTAMPEVVGDTGVMVASSDPDEVAAGIREALAFDEAARRRARERILREFPLEKRRRGLQALVAEALGEEH